MNVRESVARVDVFVDEDSIVGSGPQDQSLLGKVDGLRVVDRVADVVHRSARWDG